MRSLIRLDESSATQPCPHNFYTHLTVWTQYQPRAQWCHCLMVRCVGLQNLLTTVSIFFKRATFCIAQSLPSCDLCPSVSQTPVIMDARSAMRPCYILPMFFYIFFMAALVGQTAERIFTKLSHMVDIRCYLRTY